MFNLSSSVVFASFIGFLFGRYVNQFSVVFNKIITSKERTRMISFLYATTGFSSGQPWEGIWFAISCLIACIVWTGC